MNTVPKRRLPPSVHLELNVTEDSGPTFRLNLRLAFDFNAIAIVEEHAGLLVIGGAEKSAWNHLSSGRVLSIMLWAAIQAHHPEYGSEEGLAVLRSYMDPGNMNQIVDALDQAFLASFPAERQAEIRKMKQLATARAKSAAAAENGPEAEKTPPKEPAK